MAKYTIAFIYKRPHFRLEDLSEAGFSALLYYIWREAGLLGEAHLRLGGVGLDMLCRSVFNPFSKKPPYN